MAILDLLDLGEALLSWRLLLGLGATVATCLVIAHFSPSETFTWAVCIPVGLIGLVLSFRWQIRHD